MRTCPSVLMLFTVIAAAPRFATAATDTPIAVESYEGERPADATMLLAPIYAELQQRGYVGGDDLAAQVRARVSGDPGTLTPGQLVEAQQAVERAYGRFIDGEYEAAATAAQKAIDLYMSAPGLVSHEDALRSQEFKALIVAARSAQVLGRNDDAFRWMAEAIRTFPGQRPSSADFDPKVIALYRQVSEELTRQGSGTIEIAVTDPNAVLFMNERFVGTGHAKLEQLPPGRYRAYAAKGDHPGRVHTIELSPHGTTTVDISWEIDGATVTGPRYVSVAARGDDLGAVVQLAHALGAPRVVVLGIRTVDGRRAVVGRSVHVESQTQSYAAIQIEPLAPPEETMRRLGALLAGDKSVSTSDLITHEPARTGSVATSGMGGRRKIAIAVGVAAVIAGGAAIAFDVSAHDAYDASTREGDDARQASLFDSSNTRYHVAQGLAVVGVVGIASAAALWLTAPSESERINVGAAPSSDGLSVVVSGRF